MNFVSPLFRRAAFLSGLALAAPAGLCAQATCGDLVVERIWYAAFDSTAIEVLLTNNGGMDFSGPMMDLVDADQDTIAAGQMNWFVLPSGTHTHLLHQVQGMPLPTAPFTGEALLTYHDTGGVEVCVLPVNGIELCPPAPCTQLYLGIHQTDPLVFGALQRFYRNGFGPSSGLGQFCIDHS